MSQVAHLEISDIVEAVRTGKVSASEQVAKAIKRAKAASDYDAFIHLTETRAIKRAQEIDQQVANGDTTGKLLGVPFAVKDNFLAFDGPTTAAAEFLRDFVSPVQATAIERLEAEGAICIGKTNLDAFANGSSSESSVFGPTLNAVSKQHVAGGSSAGSAVAVALDIVPFTLGSDTGGSIRQPASFNGVYGIKPTYGMISRSGVIAMASSTDSVGAFANNPEDLELVLEVMAGQSPDDMVTLPDYFQARSVADVKYKIGVLQDSLSAGVDREVEQVLDDYIARAKDAGHTISQVELPLADASIAMYYAITSAEIASNLARFDGIGYGSRAKGAKQLTEVYEKSRAHGFTSENKRRILIGSLVQTEEYFEKYYMQAVRGRTMLIEQFDEIFSKVDILITPTAPTTAFQLGAHQLDPTSVYLTDVMNVPASLAGLPALSIPAGTAATEGLPIGVQVIAARQQDEKLLNFAKLMSKDSK